MYPLRFSPIYRQYIWGGRRLQSILRKPLGEGDKYAESWEVVDHGEDQSVVAHGPLAGRTLKELVESHGPDLLGRHAPQKQFPLLFKFLDAHRNLSVQVHPNDQQAARLDPPDLGKTEAWVVLHAEPGSVIYAGLKRGFDRAALEREINRGTTELCLHRIEPNVGDCIFIPAGTVHALGAGLVIAEIQQASDTTFRLFDWNRVGADGQTRPLHVAQSLDVICFDAEPVKPQAPQETDCPFSKQLVACDKFVMNRSQFRGKLTIGGDNRCHIISVIAGAVELAGDPFEPSLRLGQTALLPASIGAVTLTAHRDATVLDMHLF